MLRKAVVGEVVFPQVGNVNGMPQRCGILPVIDAERKFSAPPAPRTDCGGTGLLVLTGSGRTAAKSCECPANAGGARHG